MSKPTVDDVIAHGPETVRELANNPLPLSNYDPSFSWMLLASAAGFECATAGDPVLRARWAAAAADLHDGIANTAEKTGHDLAADVWRKAARRYRALSEGCR